MNTGAEARSFIASEAYKGSANGKAALLAMALGDRRSGGFPSGCGQN